MGSIVELLNTYKEYILNDKIGNCIDIYRNEYTIKFHTNTFKMFLEIYKPKNYENNKTYLYFKSLFYYSSFKHIDMLGYMDVLSDEPNYLYLVGYYYHKMTKKDLAIKYYTKAADLKNQCAIEALGYYYYIEKEPDLMLKYLVMAIWYNSKYSKLYLKSYCKRIEGNELKYYEHVNFPKILTLTLCNRKSKVKLFLPDELLNLIYTDYMMY